MDRQPRADSAQRITRYTPEQNERIKAHLVATAQTWQALVDSLVLPLVNGTAPPVPTGKLEPSPWDSDLLTPEVRQAAKEAKMKPDLWAALVLTNAARGEAPPVAEASPTKAKAKAKAATGSGPGVTTPPGSSGWTVPGAPERPFHGSVPKTGGTGR